MIKRNKQHFNSSFVETWMESGTGEGFETPNEMLRWIKDLRLQSKQFSV